MFHYVRHEVTNPLAPHFAAVFTTACYGAAMNGTCEAYPVERDRVPRSRPVALKSASAILAGAGFAGTAALRIELGGLNLPLSKKCRRDHGSFSFSPTADRRTYRLRTMVQNQEENLTGSKRPEDDQTPATAHEPNCALRDWKNRKLRSSMTEWLGTIYS
jgi:hypothetical protein